MRQEPDLLLAVLGLVVMAVVATLVGIALMVAGLDPTKAFTSAVATGSVAGILSLISLPHWFPTWFSR